MAESRFGNKTAALSESYPQMAKARLMAHQQLPLALAPMENTLYRLLPIAPSNSGT
jgi:hypothetical protein